MSVGLDVAPLAADARRHGALGARPASAASRRIPTSSSRRSAGAAPGRWTAVARDVLWYPALLPRQAPAHVDVLHCTTFRGPPRAQVRTS